jgi:hypothetical protein
LLGAAAGPEDSAAGVGARLDEIGESEFGGGEKIDDVEGSEKAHGTALKT